MESCFKACLQDIPLAGQHLRIDGKELRGTVPSGKEHAFVQMVNVWVGELSLSFGQYQEETIGKSFARHLWNLKSISGTIKGRLRGTVSLGETITSSFVEFTINQIVARRCCKKQQMQWSKKGALLLLVMRSKVFNQDLRECFLHWYPNLKTETEELK